MAFSDATKQVLDLALERLSTDPSFPPAVLKRLGKLVDQGLFKDTERVLAAIEQTSGLAEEASADGD